MNWREAFKDRIVTAEAAVTKIKSGSRVVVGHCIGEPGVLIDALVSNKDQYENVEIIHMVPMGKGEYTKPEMAGHFRHNSIFVGGSTRAAVNDGRADYTPAFFHEVPRLFRNNILPVDVALVTLGTPDKHGYCSLGTSVDYTKSAVECAKLVIAQINSNMPRTFGDSFIHISDVDYLVEANAPLIELIPPEISDIERAIGENCAQLIADGSTLQLGIGAIPDAVLLFLKNKKNLGIHSEMISDGVVELVESGVITNSSKTLHRGKIVVTFLMGTKRLYDFADDNPMIEMYPVDYVNNPLVIMKNNKMVSINSCVQVDIMGQVSSETIGLKQFSGVGGQVDFIRGVCMSQDGISIIAMPSTASRGTVSRIVPILDTGAAVTTSRNDVDFIVTEYGVARLKGKTLKDRGKDLIKISHPDFRAQLNEVWDKRYRG